MWYALGSACPICVSSTSGIVHSRCCPAFRPHPHSPGGISRRIRMSPCMCLPPGAKCVRGLRVFSDARYSARAPAAHVACPFGSHMYRLRVHLRGQCASEGRTSPLLFRRSARDNTDRRHIPADPHVPPACSPSGAVCFRGLRVFSAVRRSGRAKPVHDFMKPRPHIPAAVQRTVRALAARVACPFGSRMFCLYVLTSGG